MGTGHGAERSPKGEANRDGVLGKLGYVVLVLLVIGLCWGVAHI